MNSIPITDININQVVPLQTLSTQTFSETFLAHNSEEDMKLYLASSFNLTTLQTELENSYSKFYCAYDGQNIVGYLKINWGNAQSELKDSTALELERIYVLKSHLGQKVGLALYEKALSVAKELDLDYIWLGVWEKNERALQFYKRNGFVEFDKHIFKLGKDEQTDLLMKYELK